MTDRRPPAPVGNVRPASIDTDALVALLRLIPAPKRKADNDR